MWFAGRADEIIKIASHRLGTIEVETAFMRHPAVAEAGVTGRPDELRGEVIAAFIVLKHGHQASETLRDELLATVRHELGPVAVIGELSFVDLLPKTRSGKIMRRVLRAVVAGVARPVAAVFFDLYGTLLDLEHLAVACEGVAPGRGHAFARAWRAEQLRLTWLGTIIDACGDFETVTADALAWTAQGMGVNVGDASRELAHAFDELPVRREARPTPDELLQTGLVLGVLSNGSAGMLARALGRSGLQDVFEHVLSADDARRYKPHPSVYALAADATCHPRDAIGFVTANDWDAAGASAFGLRVAWLRLEGQAEPPRVAAPEPEVTTWEHLSALFVR